MWHGEEPRRSSVFFIDEYFRRQHETWEWFHDPYWDTAPTIVWKPTLPPLPSDEELFAQWGGIEGYEAIYGPVGERLTAQEWYDRHHREWNDDPPDMTMDDHGGFELEFETKTESLVGDIMHDLQDIIINIPDTVGDHWGGAWDWIGDASEWVKTYGPIILIAIAGILVLWITKGRR